MNEQRDSNGRLIVLEDISKFYGEVLGVNQVNLSIPPGITSLVGPNGSGKTTLMNLMTGLIRPTRGSVTYPGQLDSDPETLFRRVGYCTQFDSFPRGMTGERFLTAYLGLHGFHRKDALRLANQALERVRLTDAAGRKIAGYSKGMRQLIKLAQSICHHPEMMILDEPLNGLDPMVRAEIIDLFRKLAAEGRHLIISSHILHEVDQISDHVVILNQGYVVAEGDIRGLRDEIETHPMQILIRCDHAAELAAKVLQQDHVVEIKMHDDRGGLLVSTRDAAGFYLALNRIVMEDRVTIETVTPADEDVHAVYQYLVGYEEGGS
jgi:ABC-2 type transport system ATP-binding protein